MEHTLSSLEIERCIIGGLINNPDAFCEIDSIISPKDFYNPIHQSLYMIIRNSLSNREKIDRIIIAQKGNEMGLNFNSLNMFQYLEDISISVINLNGIVSYCKDLAKLSIRRELIENSEKEKKYILENGDKPISEIVANIDKIHNDKIIQYGSENDEPKDLYANVRPLIEKIAKNPTGESGLRTSYKWFNKYFSGIKSGDGAYFFYARYSQGKSVWLFNLAQGISLENQVPTLYIDTEMSLDLNIFRAAAAESDLNSYYIQTGKWAKDSEMIRRVKNSFEKIDKYRGLMYHIYAPNKSIHEILGIIRKWYYKVVGRGNKCVIVYDYLKIANNFDGNRNEWQQFGDQMSYLNEIGHVLDVPILLAGQQNREGSRTGGYKQVDDDATIGGSDRIGQYARFCALFRRKSNEEIAEHGEDAGTHILKPIKWSRDQGELDFNSHSVVRVMNNDNHHHNGTTNKYRYVPNYLCYEIKNYKISERFTLKEIYDRNNGKNNNLQAGDGSLKTGADF